MNGAAGAGGRLVGKVAVVTGAASGMGRAVAERLTAEGAAVVGFDRAGPDAGEHVVAWVQGDVAREDDVAGAMATVVAGHARIDVLVNAAGVVGGGELVEETSVETWRRVLETNLMGTFLCIKHVVPPMKEHGVGAIVNFASTTALRPSQVGTSPYTASKGGVAALTRQLVLELAPFGITVNAIAPGPVPTAMTAHHGEDWAREKARVIPAGRLGRPDEAAAAVAFLVSDEARYVNGQVLAMDGGMTSVVVH